MYATITSILAVTAGLTAPLVILLAVVKLFHREVERYRNTAYYTSAVGELNRTVLSGRPRQGWAGDPLFHAAVADHRLMVAGEGRRFVDSLVDQLEAARIAAALEQAGTDTSVEPLGVAIHDDGWRVRARAVVALGAMAADVAVEEIAQLLTDRQWSFRQDAAGALTQVPGGTDRLVLELAGSDDFAADTALTQLTISGALSEPRPLSSRT